MADSTTVLIVDDSLLARKTISAFVLEQFPEATIIAAQTGDEALEKTRGVGFDVATIDYNTPGMDGLPLAFIAKPVSEAGVCGFLRNARSAA